MTAATFNDSNTSRSYLGYVIILVLLIVLAGLVYGLLQDTVHSIQGHATQVWNAASIKAYFDSGACKPSMYYCPEGDFEVHWCAVNDDKSIGLVIGRTVRQVVTGFMASTKYWTTRCR